MTVGRDDMPDDEILAGLRRLRTCDVSARRAGQLRERCHAVLLGQAPEKRTSRVAGGAVFRRVIVPGLGGAWCLAYLMEILRCTAAIYAYFGTHR